jgi:hypothetical protein
MKTKRLNFIRAFSEVRILTRLVKRITFTNIELLRLRTLASLLSSCELRNKSVILNMDHVPPSRVFLAARCMLHVCL